MIGLDTNVLVRYLAQDDAKQSAQATRLIESLTPQQPGYVTLTSIVELVWVLESSYDATHDDVAGTLEDLLRIKDIRLEHAEIVARALRLFASGHPDFADCLITASSLNADCSVIYSFDKAAIRKPGMTAVP